MGAATIRLVVAELGPERFQGLHLEPLARNCSTNRGGDRAIEPVVDHQVLQLVVVDDAVFQFK